MTRLARLTRDDLSDAQAGVWDSIVDSRGVGLELLEDGSMIGPFNAFVHVPEIGRRLSSLGALLRFRTSIERRLSEIAICTVGAHWRSEFEFWAHAPMAIEHGVDPAVIDALRAGGAPEFARDDERIVHAVANQLLVERRVDDETFATAVDLLGEVGMVELAALVGYYCTISMILNLFEVPLPAGADPVWTVSDTT
jgi:4-carboxymuconolactone decarboxylase